jgi:hypothetical protein
MTNGHTRTGPGPADYDTWTVFGGSQHLRNIPGVVFGSSPARRSRRSFCGDSANSLDLSSADIGRAKDSLTKRAPGAVPWRKEVHKSYQQQELKPTNTDSVLLLPHPIPCAAAKTLQYCSLQILVNVA